jgi:hypothetical protein
VGMHARAQDVLDLRACTRVLVSALLTCAYIWRQACTRTQNDVIVHTFINPAGYYAGTNRADRS